MKNNLKNGIVIVNDVIPKLMSVFINVGGITLYPFIIVKKDFNNPITINHERIHIAQQKELFVIFFYVLYVWYWIQNRFKYYDVAEDAYYNLPFEREAYKHQEDFSYLNNRPKQAWKNYFHTRNY